jgi:hypothetical protein
MDLTDRLDIDELPVTVVRRKKKNRSHLELTYGGQVTSELFPFKGVMSYQLEKRGYNVKNLPFKNLIPLYYNEFVSNRNNTFSSFQPVNCYEFSNNTSFKIKPSDSFNGDIDNFRNKNHFSEVNDVVDGIVRHFRTSQLKKRYAFESGLNPKHSLTTDELIQANATDRILSHLESQILFDKPIKQGQIINMLFWGFLLLAFYYILE